MDTATSLRLCGVTGVRREDLLVAHLTALAGLHRRLDAGRCGDGRAAPAVPQPLRRPSARTCEVHQPSGAVARGRAVAVDDAGRPGASTARPVASPTPRGTSSTCGPRSEGGPVDAREPRPRPAPGTSAGPARRPAPPRPPRPPGGRDGAPDVLPPGTEPVDDVAGALLGEPRTMRRRQVSAGAEVSLLSARRFWHALGFPNVGDEDTVFTEADLQALRSVVGLVREGVFDETTALSMTRALGRTTDRLAVWQTQLMAEALGDLPEVDAWTGLVDADGASSDTAAPCRTPQTARAAARQLTEIADRLEPLLVYAWRRHLERRHRAHGRRRRARPTTDTGVVRSVGFADLVSFTTLVRRLSERQLAAGGPALRGARLRRRHRARGPGDQDRRRRGALRDHRDRAGRAPSPWTSSQAMADDDFLPDVRVGLAFGPVVSRLGDVFGTTVNRASRLTGVARPGHGPRRRRARGVAGQPLRFRDEPAAAADAARDRGGDPVAAAPRRAGGPTRHGRRWGHPLR